jgi:GxxExxY protein
MEDALQSAAEEVFNGLGAGFTESVYHRAMHVELSSRGIMFSSEGSIPVFYRGAPVGRRHPKAPRPVFIPRRWKDGCR